MDLNDRYNLIEQEPDWSEHFYNLQIQLKREENAMNINPNVKESASQKKAILNYMENGKRITALEALTLFGCMRLQARIFDLVGEGYPIGRQYVITNTGKRVMQYWLKS